MSRFRDGLFGLRYLRHLWSHESASHRIAVRLVNRVLALAPDRPKYELALVLRRQRLPYRLIDEGSVVVQVGAPSDTLRSGRSRAARFAMLVGPSGKVVAIEPDSKSAQDLRRWSTRTGNNQMEVVEMGAWSEVTDIEVYFDENHPATSFTAGTKNYDASRMKSYRSVIVAATTLDHEIDRLGLEKVDFISITTNGAEKEILAGAREIIDKHRPMISLAGTLEYTKSAVESLDYRLLAADDRGFTYVFSGNWG